METVFWLPIAGVGIGAALWFLTSRRKDHSSSPPAPKNRASPAVDSLDRIPAGSLRRLPQMGANFEAVSIQICHHPCQAARELRGQRFLPEEMPDLPLPGCDRKCNCSFVHHRDRRDRTNRRAPYLSTGETDGELLSIEQRIKSDRRKK